MTRTLSFEDPNIAATGAFEVNGCKITAPVFTLANVGDIIASTTRHAASYFGVDHGAFEAIRKSYVAWSDPDYALRQESLPILADLTGFSEANIACFGLAPLRRIELRPDQLRELPARLRHLIETDRYRNFSGWGGGYLKGYGFPKIAYSDRPRKVLQILAGNVIGPTWLSACLGVALQCPQFIKLSHRDLASFMLYLQSLNEIDPSFRATIACGYYPGEGDANARLLHETDLVVATGSDDSVNAIRATLMKVNRSSRLIAHGLKISLQVIAKEYAVAEVAELAAWGIVAFDGNGCFSPANVYIERGGRLTPEQFAEAMADSMACISFHIPPKRTIDVAERVTNYRYSQMRRKLSGENVRIIKSLNTDYTVIVDGDHPALAPTCQERVVAVKPVDDIRSVPHHIGHLSHNLQTVGLAVPSEDILQVSDGLGAAGVTNIKIVGTEYTIDLAEPHDGLFDFAQSSMTDELRWTSISFSDTDDAIQGALEMKKTCLGQLAGQSI